METKGKSNGPDPLFDIIESIRNVKSSIRLHWLEKFVMSLDSTQTGETDAFCDLLIKICKTTDQNALNAISSVIKWRRSACSEREQSAATCKRKRQDTEPEQPAAKRPSQTTGMRFCRACREDKPVDQFPAVDGDVSVRSFKGLNYYCEKCVNRPKVCPMCSSEKRVGDFYAKKTGYIHTNCIECAKTRQAERNRLTKERERFLKGDTDHLETSNIY